MGTALSTLGTLLPMAVDPGLGLLAGLVVGPNLEDVYAGELGYAARRTGTRAAPVGGTAALVYAIRSGGGCTVLGKDGRSGTVAAAAVLTGVVATGVLAVREIRGVDDRIRERNDRSSPRVRMTPTLDLRGRRVGLAVGVRF